MEKRKDTSTSSTIPITSTASEVSLRFVHQSERTRSNSDSTDNEEIPVTSSPPADDLSNGDRVSLEEGEGRRTEEMSDKEESTEERRNEKKRLNRNEEDSQERELEEKSSKKSKTEEVREKEAVEVQNETNHSDSDSDSDATDIPFTVMDYTDDFYKEKPNTSNKGAAGSQENEDASSSDSSDEEISQPVADRTNDITDRTNYTDNTYPEGLIMINVGLVLNTEASHADDVHPFYNSSLPVSTDVSSEESEIGGIHLLGSIYSIESPVSVVSTDQGSDCVY